MENQQRKQELTKSQRKSRRRRRFLRTIIVIAGILVIIRISLPFVALRLINKKLAAMPDLVGHIDDIDISLIGKSLMLKNLVLKKKNGKIEMPFLRCQKVYVGIESFKQRANSIIADSCEINFVKGASDETSQLSLEKEWLDLLKEMPLKPNTLHVTNSEIHFIEKYRKAPIDLSLQNIVIKGQNLKNLAADSSKFPSHISIAGDLEGAKFKSEIKLNPDKKPLVLEAVSSFSPVDVKRIRNFLISYVDFDVKSGTLSASSVIKIHNNRLDGYIDPVAKSLVFYDKEADQDKKFGAKVKQYSLQVVANVLDRPGTERISTRIELHGPLDEVKVNTWEIIAKGLKRSIAPRPELKRIDQKKSKDKKESRKERRKKKKKGG